MRTRDNGIAAVAYAPSCLDTTVEGAAVRIELDTDYPFRGKLNFMITTDRPVEFSFYLRIPEWADEAHLEGDGNAWKISTPSGGILHYIITWF